jgi:Fe-S-cluster containining protein
MELTKKQESKICLSCGECCKRYSITILPEDVPKISKKLKISQKKFLQDYCELFVKVYPKSIPGILTYLSSFFPKHIGNLLDLEFNYTPPSFFVLPQLTIKRKEGYCPFLNKDNSCKIYSVRPYPCKAFPFMILPGYEESYPFCNLFSKTNKDYSKQTRAYSKRMKHYFYNVDKKGFEKLWKNPPKKGKFFLSDSLLGGITLKQLNKVMSKKIPDELT